MRVVTLNGSSGVISLVGQLEANVDSRNRDKSDIFKYTYKTAGSLKTALGRKITVSPIGEVNNQIH